MSFVNLSPQKIFVDAGERQELNSRGIVRLYFIGVDLAKKGRVAIPVKGRAINLPPIGDYVELDEVMATDLLSRSMVYDPKRGFTATFTQDAGVAAAVKAAYESGALQSDVGIDEIIRQGTLATAGIEELEAELARRRPNPQSATKKSAKSDEEVK